MQGSTERSQYPQVSHIRNLVFQGGSVKGIAYLGALQKLLSLGMSPDQIHRVGGTSAGSITALLISLNYDLETVSHLTKGLDFKKFLDEKGMPTRSKLLKTNKKLAGGSNFFTTGLPIKSVTPKIAHRLKQSFGIYDGEYFRLWAEEQIIKKLSIPNLTFAELHQAREKDPGYKDLYVVGFNLTTGLVEVFSWEHTPHVIISDAVRISMSIPYIFKPHFKFSRSEAGERVVAEEAHFYVDGGLIDNYPIWLFDKAKYVNSALPDDNTPSFNTQTLGFRLVKRDKKEFFEGVASAPENEINSILSFTKMLLQGIYKKQDSDHARSQDPSRSIYIDTVGINMLQFDLDATDQAALIRSGEQGVIDYFTNTAAPLQGPTTS